jgi:hypothetical protein
VKLQLIGPMSGLPSFNYPAFMDAAALLRSQGHEVFNPAETAGGDTSYPRRFYMKAAIGGLMSADAVVFLPGWEDSKGARLEMAIAHELEISALPLSQYQEGRGPVRVGVPDGPSD